MAKWNEAGRNYYCILLQTISKMFYSLIIHFIIVESEHGKCLYENND